MGTPGGLWHLKPEHCAHKLPASCLLTSTQKCCACEDNRIHSSTYSRYVDGLGMTNYGTRWQSYCWPCKTFWDNRIEQSGIPNRQTRIPHYPEQHKFLEHWYGFFLGINFNDGSPLQAGEPWRDVDVGRLPRTADEIHQGWPQSTFEIEIAAQAASAAQRRAVEQTPTVDIESALDQLMDEIEDEEERPQTEQGEQNATLQANATEATMENNAEAGASVENSSEEHINEIIDNARALSVRRLSYEPMIREAIGNIRSEIESLQSGIGNLNEMSTIRRNIHERLEAFTREFRRAQGIQFDEEEQDLEVTGSPDVDAQATTNSEGHTRMPRTRGLQGEFELLTTNLRTRHQNLQNATAWEDLGEFSGRRRFLGLDEPGRPTEPVSDKVKTVKLECNICYDQKADIALFPCGHVVMCEWCADVQVPVNKNTRSTSSSTVPIRKSHCPVCRVRVHQRVKLFV